MIYQDIWLNGNCVQKGIRNCENRYKVIKDYCNVLPIGFTVLDIGANMCYFGLRLIEDFGCNVLAFEFNHFNMREKYVKANKTDKLIFINRKISLADLDNLSSFCHFDLVLALSVVHHLPGNTSSWINAFRKLGNNVIIEFALNDSERPMIRENYLIPEDAKILGYGDSHLKKNFKRPMVLLCQNK